MKRRTIRRILTLVCVLALSLSLAGGAFADEEPVDIETVYAMAQKALDQQDIENIMSRHVLYHCYGEHREEMEQIWVQEPENQATASFGQNQGFYVGYDSIWEAYVEGHDTAWKTSALSYCSKNGIDTTNMTDEELEKYYGVGQLLLHVTTTAIIEVAEDGQTAQAYWYSPGMIAETGQSANTIWEAYGVDFVKENGVWKMWHLHMFTDFMCRYGDTFSTTSTGAVKDDGVPSGDKASGAPSGDKADGAPAADAQQSGGQLDWQGEEGAQIALSTAHDYLYSTQYYQFSGDRLLSQMEMVYIPLPYDSWSFDNQNFGPTAAEFASMGIDLQPWYDAHA